MAKLKEIILQLAETDYQAIYKSLSENNADKSAYLLQQMREKKYSDMKIMKELNVNTNAYYTLRSRLNQKIEEHLLQQMESPRADIIKKVANINEIIFTKKRAISIATLRKLEKELLDFDLSNELTIIYKTLKKLHIYSSEHFYYSQLYNKHIAFMLAIDKAEDLLASYFKKFSEYTLTGDETHKLELIYLTKEMENNCNLYQSHRLFIYQSCLIIFHRLFVEKDNDNITDDKKPIEDILLKVKEIFNNYKSDSIYFHLELVFEYLTLEYYTHYKLYRKAETYFEGVDEKLTPLLSNYSLYTFPAQFLNTKLERSIRLDNTSSLYEENLSVFIDYDNDSSDIPKLINYTIYRALACYYSENYQEASKWINQMLNKISLKKYPYALLEIKSILALQYCCLKDRDMFNQLSSSIQRQIRLLGKEECQNIIVFVKILKISMSDAQKNKEEKIRSLIDKYSKLDQLRLFNPTSHVNMNEGFIEKLI